MRDRFLLVFWVTARCNLRCRYCYASESPLWSDMAFSTAKTMLDRLRNRPLKIQFAGGEPLLRFDLIEEICAYVRAEGMDAVFQMQTNGTQITPALARRLRELHISVGVSLDGVPDVNNRTRGETEKVLAGIRCLGEQGMVIGLNAVVTAVSAPHLPKLVDFAYYLGNIGGIGLDLLRLAGRGRENREELLCTPEMLRTALHGMAERRRLLYSLTGRYLELREIALAKKRLAAPQPSNKLYCYASCGRSAVVLPDGTLYPCGSLLTDAYCMGHAETFAPEQAVHLPSEPGDACAGCRYEPYCPKGCPSRRIRNENNLDCVLLKTSFSIAEGETYENIHQSDSDDHGFGEVC